MKNHFKKIISICFTLSFLLSSGMISFQSKADDSSLVETIEITLSSNEYTIRKEHGKTLVEMKDFGYITKPGYPKLPSKIFTIRLPSNITVTSLSLIHKDSKKIPGSFDLVTAPSVYPLNHQLSTFDSKKTESNTISPNYPSSIYSLIGNGSYKNTNFIQVRFTPFTYQLMEHTLMFHKEITLQLCFHQHHLNQNKRIDESMNNNAAFTILNTSDEIHSIHTKNHLSFSQDSVDYLILTTKNLKESVLFLKHWRELTGFSTKIVTISEILDQYEGEDETEKIRHFLKEKHLNWGIDYLLIVGSDSLIPMKDCYPDKDNHGYTGITPTDYYYADLTGNWDVDNDGFFGERDDDRPDFIADVYVGRIPVDQPWLVEDICQKIIEFEQTDEQWKNQALLIGALLNLQNEDNSGYEKTDGAYLMESLSSDLLSPKGFQTTTLYEKDGLSPSILHCDYHLTKKNVTDELTKGYGLVNWNAHGSSTATTRLYWKKDDGDGVPESREIATPAFIYSADTPKFNDEKPAIVFSCSCQNAHPEYTNLGTSLLENGAVSFIGATRNAWGTVGWRSKSDGGCTSLDYLFTEYILKRSETVGSALYKAKYDYYTNYDWWDWKTHQNMYAFNIYGDPATSFQSITSLHRPDTPVITNGPDSGEILSNLTFSAFATDSDGHQLFYQWKDDNGMHSSWIGPFDEGNPIDLTRSWNEPGQYTLSIRVKDISAMVSNWSDSLAINITAPQIEIKKIRGGISSFHVFLENSGNAVAEHINWTIHLQEGFHLNSENNGYIDALIPGEVKKLKHSYFFGIGLPVVTIAYESKKLARESKTTSALLIGPFIII